MRFSVFVKLATIGRIHISHVDKMRMHTGMPYTVNAPGYVYILREREFIRLQETTYKIGCTNQENLLRFRSYPKNSRIILLVETSDCKRVEKELMKTFKRNFVQKKEYGNEYFAGDIGEMKKSVYDCLLSAELKKK